MRGLDNLGSTVTQKEGAMFFLVYLSSAVTWFSSKELTDLLGTCRRRNAEADITGMLLYKDGNFMQVLEGEESAVRKLLARISADLRHRGLVVIDSGHTAQREFAQWGMGFVDLQGDTHALPAEYGEFLGTSLTDSSFSQNPEHCHKLLRMFRHID
jgi:Sensors of blue-light using FAD